VAKVTVRKETGKLVIDFTFRSVRCREQTALDNTPTNKKRVQAVVDELKKAQRAGTFRYEDFFPNSPKAARFTSQTDSAVKSELAIELATREQEVGPKFKDFANLWVDEHTVIALASSAISSHCCPH